MKYSKSLAYFIAFATLISFYHQSKAQCIADAGNDTVMCGYPFGLEVRIGGNAAIGGVSPYQYSWSATFQDSLGTLTASDFLSDTTMIKPILDAAVMRLAGGKRVSFILTVTDNNGKQCRDTMKLQFSGMSDKTLDPQSHFVKLGDSVMLTAVFDYGIPPFTYEWSPPFTISDTASANTFVFPNEDTDYLFIVRDSAGCIAGGRYYVYVTPVGMREEIPEESLKVYPNPTSTSINIHIDKKEGVDYHISDYSGKIIKKGILNYGQNHIDVESWLAGIYLLHIYNDNKILTRKMVIE